MLKYLGVAAILAATYGVTGGTESVAIILSLLALMFYIMAFRLFCGLSQATLVNDINILQVITIYMIYVTMGIITFMSDYSLVTYFALPWLAIQAAINILSILIKLDIIGIEHK